MGNGHLRNVVPVEIVEHVKNPNHGHKRHIKLADQSFLNLLPLRSLVIGNAQIGRRTLVVVLLIRHLGMHRKMIVLGNRSGSLLQGHLERR